MQAETSQIVFHKFSPWLASFRCWQQELWRGKWKKKIREKELSTYFRSTGSTGPPSWHTLKQLHSTPSDVCSLASEWPLGDSSSYGGDPSFAPLNPHNTTIPFSLCTWNDSCFTNLWNISFVCFHLHHSYLCNQFPVLNHFCFPKGYRSWPSFHWKYPTSLEVVLQ